MGGKKKVTSKFSIVFFLHNYDILKLLQIIFYDLEISFEYFPLSLYKALYLKRIIDN